MIVKVNLYLILLVSLRAPQGPLKVSEIPVWDAMAQISLFHMIYHYRV